MPEIRLEDIEKQFAAAKRVTVRWPALLGRKGVPQAGPKKVLHRLSVTIRDRSFFTLVGPSGSGKSTALNIIAGLDREFSGNVRFDGKVVNALSPRERDVAMVFQSYALYPHLKVYENIAFPLRLREKDSKVIDTAVRGAAEALGLLDLLQRLPRQLSGGQRQRVALARALVRRPEVFLMDEPLSNLDASLRLQMRTEIRRIHRAYGVTTIYVTHDQEEAMVLSDQIAVLDDGVLQQLAPPREIYERPRNLFVAQFIGSPPMNVLPGPHFIRLAGLESLASAGDAEELVFGIRPAQAVAHRVGRGGHARGDLTLRGTVRVVETTGDESWGDVDLGPFQLRTRVDLASGIEEGNPAEIRLPFSVVHCFRRGNGERIENGPLTLAGRAQA